LFFAFIPPDYLAGSKLTMLSKGRLFSWINASLIIIK
jgi:hypothetical protein